MVAIIIIMAVHEAAGNRAPNPLDSYRKKATFDIDALRILLDGEEAIKFKNQVWDTLAKDPLFAPPSRELTVEEHQALTFRRVKRLIEYALPFTNSPATQLSFLQALASLDNSLPLLYGLNSGVRKVVWAWLRVITSLCTS